MEQTKPLPNESNDTVAVVVRLLPPDFILPDTALPEDVKRVLVIKTVRNVDTNIFPLPAPWSFSIAYRWKGKWEFSDNEKALDDYDCEVVAWKPLPDFGRQ